MEGWEMGKLRRMGVEKAKMFRGEGEVSRL